MDHAAAGWVPAEILVAALTLVVGALAAALRYIAHETSAKLKAIDDSTKANTAALQALELRLVQFAPLTSMTAMGERITAAQQAATAEQNHRIEGISKDVTIMKYVFDKGPKS